MLSLIPPRKSNFWLRHCNQVPSNKRIFMHFELENRILVVTFLAILMQRFLPFGWGRIRSKPWNTTLVTGIAEDRNPRANESAHHPRTLAPVR